RTGKEGGLFRPGNYLNGGDYRTLNGTEARYAGARVYFFSSGDDEHHVQAAEETLAEHCSDRNRQSVPASIDSRRSSRRECGRDWRSFRACRRVQYRAGPGRVLPDAVERWRLRSSTNLAPRDNFRIYR